MRQEVFFFTSDGKRKITKVVEFEEIYDGIWNMALGDIVDGNLNYKHLSNNGDAFKVIATVLHIIKLFMAKFPKRVIFIIGSDARRTNLYNWLFKKQYEAIQEEFELNGMKRGGKWETYSPNKQFKAFEMRLKKV